MLNQILSDKKIDQCIAMATIVLSFYKFRSSIVPFFFTHALNIGVVLMTASLERNKKITPRQVKVLRNMFNYLNACSCTSLKMPLGTTIFQVWLPNGTSKSFMKSFTVATCLAFASMHYRFANVIYNRIENYCFGTPLKAEEEFITKTALTKLLSQVSKSVLPKEWEIAGQFMVAYCGNLLSWKVHDSKFKCWWHYSASSFLKGGAHGLLNEVRDFLASLISMNPDPKNVFEETESLWLILSIDSLKELIKTNGDLELKKLYASCPTGHSVTLKEHIAKWIENVGKLLCNVSYMALDLATIAWNFSYQIYDQTLAVCTRYFYPATNLRSEVLTGHNSSVATLLAGDNGFKRD